VQVLIAGGLGYLGGRISEYLHNKDYNIQIGTRNTSKNIGFKFQPNLKRINWYNSNQLKKICKDIDVIVHSSGMNAQDCIKDPIGAFEFNGNCTKKLLDAAISSGVRRYIYLSTAHVYRSPLVGEINEEISPNNLHPYATSHLAGENHILLQGQKKNIEGFVLRLSNVYGHPVDRDVNCWMLLMNNLCKQVSIKKIIELKSDSNQQRDFMTLTDFCKVVEIFIKKDFEYFNYDIYNVGSGKSKTLFQMAKLIQSRYNANFGLKPKIIHTSHKVNKDKIPLNYICEKLNLLRINLRNNYNDEIDNLLKFCNYVY
jgi:UDP-glucose 4-epimerase